DCLLLGNKKSSIILPIHILHTNILMAYHIFMFNIIHYLLPLQLRDRICYIARMR
ncbi:hypothetical protein ACJX0J_036419, partial [Zea mays]